MKGWDLRPPKAEQLALDLGEAVSVRPAEEADCAYIGPADRSPAAGVDASACAVTGHRVLGAEFSRDRLRAALRSLAEGGVRIFFCGMAQGFGLACADEILSLRSGLPLRLIACVPCAVQADRYPRAAREQYDRILAACDDRVLLHDRYCHGCMFERNRYMVDRADVLLAYFQGRRGGTGYTVNYAKKCGIPVYFL